jgi:hypothetical protein
MKTIQTFILASLSLYINTFKPVTECNFVFHDENNFSDTQVELEERCNNQPIELSDYGLIPANQKAKPVEPEYNPFDAIPSFK